MTEPVTVLLCADPLNPRRVDPHFAAQAAAVREAGGGVALLDHDSLLAGHSAEAVSRVPRGTGALRYRGWMIPGDKYRELDAALAARECALLTAPDGYTAAHELPGWYPAFQDLTPASVWTAGVPDDVAGFVAGLQAAGPALVKDYVKSRKHDWDTACFIPDTADSASAQRVVRRFVELQGDDLAGGLVLRAFERFDGAGGRADEARVWWLAGAPILVGPHPDTPDIRLAVDPSELAPIAAAVRALANDFVTTDLARSADTGRLRVVEVGDGQVSDLPGGPDVDPVAFYSALLSGVREAA